MQLETGKEYVTRGGLRVLCVGRGWDGWACEVEGGGLLQYLDDGTLRGWACLPDHVRHIVREYKPPDVFSGKVSLIRRKSDGKLSLSVIPPNDFWEEIGSKTVTITEGDKDG